MLNRSIAGLLKKISLKAQLVWGKPLIFFITLVPSILLVTSQFWLFPRGMLPSPDKDLKSNLLPIIQDKAQLLDGDFPVSSPWYGGESNFANPLWGFFYIPSTVIFLALPITLAVEVVVYLHIILGWLFMTLLTWEFTANRFASVFSGFLYIFSGIYVTRLVNFHFEKIFGLALLPLAFYFYKKVYDESSYLYGIILGGILAMIYYAGGVYLTAYLLLFFFIILLIAIALSSFSKDQILCHIIIFLSFVLTASIKLIPNIVLSLNAERPEFNATPLLVAATAFILPDQLWIGDWKGFPTYYVTLGGVSLAMLGFYSLYTSRSQKMTFSLLVGILFFIYLSLGFPPFGVPFPLSHLRVGDRALMIPGFLLCLFAGIGIAYLFKSSKRHSLSILVLILTVVGFFFEVSYMIGRGSPILLDLIAPYLELMYRQREITLLQIFSWINVWDIRSGMLLSIVFLFLFYYWVKRNALSVPKNINILAGIILFSVAFATASQSLKYETNPLIDAELTELRDKVAESTVAFANLEEKDLRGRAEIALAGTSHLLNPYYGSFGQSVDIGELALLDYVVSKSSPEEIRNGLEINKYWGDRELIAVVEGCELFYVDKYHTDDTQTFRDWREVSISEVKDGKQEPDAKELLYLYKVKWGKCSGEKNSPISELQYLSIE